ncbi:MAG: PilZ domain-containing protein [Desulfobacterales bacterium]|nr:PilZ domain-containing protein [Desulfobacterales bacterium]
MTDSPLPRPRYNVALSRLMRRIIELSEEEQEKLLRHIEEMVARQNDPPERGHQRKNCLITVDYAVNGRAYRSFVPDISSGGMFIETREKMTVGQEMMFAFTISKSSSPVKCRGEVAWASPDGIGVRFLDLPKLEENILRATISAMPECAPSL